MASEVIAALIGAAATLFVALLAVAQTRTVRVRNEKTVEITKRDAQIEKLQLALIAKSEALQEAIRQRDRLEITAELSDKFFGRLNSRIGGEKVIEQA